MLLEVHAREKAHMTENWEVFRYECFPHMGKESTRYFELEGAVAPRKGNGRPNWKKRDRATQKIIVITIEEHDIWKKEWEIKTGKCSECEGKGEVLESISVYDGVKYRNCNKCLGTGKGEIK